MRYCVAVILACWLLRSHATLAQDLAGPVGPSGNSELLAIRGITSVPPHEVVESLFADLDVAYSFTDSPMEVFQRLLVEKTILGLRHSGFPSPHVSIADRFDRLELNVQEGPRWMAGEIRIRGAQRVDVGKLVDGLLLNDTAAANSRARESRWAVGQPAHLDEPTRILLAQRTDELLAQQGYTRAKSDVEIVGNPSVAAATLLVTIQDEGMPVRVGDIELVGNKVHTREQLLAYLQLPVDAVLSTDLCREIEKRLQRSGRFVDCRFYGAAKGSSPRLWLDEFAEAPRLDQPLSREEDALIKLAAWLDAFEQRNEDLVIHCDGTGFWLEFCVSPRRGIIARMGARESSAPPGSFDFAVVYSEDQIALFSRKEARSLMVNFASSQSCPTAMFTLISGAKKWTGGYGINFWIKPRSKDTVNRRAQIRPNLAPSAALSVVRKHHARCSWEGPILTARWNDHSVRVDSRDGRFVDAEYVDSHLHLFSKKGRGNKTKWETSQGPGVFDVHLEEIVRATAGFTNVADMRRLASGTAEFVCGQLGNLGVLTGAKQVRLSSAFVRLAQRGALQPLDDLFMAAMWSRPERFYIPQAAKPKGDSWSVDVSSRRGVGFSMPELRLSLADELFLRDSHPWLVWREAAFILGGKREHMHERLSRLFPEDQTGPLTTLALAEAMQVAGMLQEAGNWSRARLDDLSLDSFRRDYVDLIQPESKVSNYVMTIAEALRGLDEAEAKILFDLFRSFKWMTKSQTRQALAFLAELRRDPRRPTPAAIAAALDALWQSSLRYRVEHRLKTIADAAPKPDVPQQQASRPRLLFR